MSLLDKFLNGHRLFWSETIAGYAKKYTICNYASFVLDNDLIIKSKNISLKLPLISMDHIYYEEKYGLIIGKIPVEREYCMITFCLEIKGVPPDKLTAF